jgi:prepilin-type N-terminal cleavage/methylation domain-containing protein
MRKYSAFTLVELMVVIAIIAILATAGITQYTKFIKNSRDTARIEDLKAINTLLITETTSTGRSPNNTDVISTLRRLS